MKLESYSAVAIGSLPYQQPDEAIELIWKYLPDYPHWPQLPQRGAQEHLVYQYLNPLVTLSILEQQASGKTRVAEHDNDWQNKLTGFYTEYLQGSESGQLDYFATPRQSAEGFYAFLSDIEKNGVRQAKMLKGQVAGPLTVSLYLYDQEGKSAYYHPDTRDILVKTLTLQARWQAQKLSQYGLPVMIFLDDPAVAAVGASTFVSVKRQDVVDIYREMLAEIRKDAAVVGVHSCAGVDWSVFVDAGFDIISFDADQYFDSLMVYTESIRNFLTSGGMLAWGGVPTTDAIFKTDLDDLLRKWQQQRQRLEKAGISKELLRQCVITPSCGAGTLTQEASRRIYRVTHLLSNHLQEAIG